MGKSWVKIAMFMGKSLGKKKNIGKSIEKNDGKDWRLATSMDLPNKQWKFTRKHDHSMEKSWDCFS